VNVIELIQKLQRALRDGRLEEDDFVMLRDPEVSDGAVEAGSDPYTDEIEILFPGDGRVVLLVSE
jgi:hypothetical protein